MRRWRRRWLRTGEDGGSFKVGVGRFTVGEATRTMVRVLDDDLFGLWLIAACTPNGSRAVLDPRLVDSRRVGRIDILKRLR